MFPYLKSLPCTLFATHPPIVEFIAPGIEYGTKLNFNVFSINASKVNPLSTIQLLSLTLNLIILFRYFKFIVRFFI